MPIAIAVLITSHNRKDKTMFCLDSLFSQEFDIDVHLKVYLVDSASTDGTSEAVEKKYRDVAIIHGNENLFWSRGMRVAFTEAMEKSYDHYLWLNDDVILFKDAIKNLLNTYSLVAKKFGKKSIIAGPVCDPVTGVVTYGGKKRRSILFPLSFLNIEPKGKPVICDTFNGNCVLIPQEVVRVTGNIDECFIQSGADFDYGFRARKNGCAIWLASRYVGTCSRNPIEGTWLDKKLSLRERFSLLPHLTKGLPPFEKKIFAKRYGGPFWFIYWLLWYRRIF